MLTVKILGAGCARCRHLEAETRMALERMEPPISYELLKVTDAAEFMYYGVFLVPALVMNDRLVSAGRVPKREEISAWALELGKGPA